MQHWFDRLSKRVAANDMSRRRAILGVGAMAAVAATSGRVGSAFAQSLAPSRDETCVRRTHSGRFGETRRRVHQGLTGHLETSFDQATGTTIAVLTVDRGAKLVARVETQRTKDGAVKITTTYGSEIRGARIITHTSRDGRQFLRSIDGRPPESRAPQQPGSPQQPSAPRIDPALERDLRALFAEMSQEQQNCRQEDEPEVPRTTPPRFHPLVRENSQTRTGAERNGFRSFAPSPPGTFRRAAFNWYEPASRSSPSCTRCGTRCNDAYGKCVFNADTVGDFIWSALSDFGPQIAAKISACMVALGICGAHCHLPGEGCCPVQCGGLTDNCCGENSTCMLPKQRTCCPPNQIVCKGTCCERGVVSCAPDGFCGCAAGQTPCGNDCCEGGNICCGNTGCCTAARCRSGVCSDIPVQQAKCNGVQCGAFDNCCGGKCCTGTCTSNNQCCPPGRGCGNNCCGPTQTCTDSNKGICSNPTGCPAGQKSCETHMPGAPNGVNTQICCPSNVTCCNGSCCPPNTECCGSDGCRSTCVR